jgi:hypothetical protein
LIGQQKLKRQMNQNIKKIGLIGLVMVILKAFTIDLFLFNKFPLIIIKKYLCKSEKIKKL